MTTAPRQTEEIELARLSTAPAAGPDSAWLQFNETGVRSWCNEQVVDDYRERMEQGDCFPPIVVFRDGDHLYVGDGFHRIEASNRAGFKNIMAEIRTGSRLDAVWFALGANRQHGQRMSPEDKCCAILRALKEFPGKSNRAIADQIGVSESYIRKVVGAECPEVRTSAHVTGKDGKAYSSKQDRKTKAPAPTNSTSAGEIVPASTPPGMPPVKTDEATPSTPEPVTPPTKPTKSATLRSLWMHASKTERDEFLRWVDTERVKDLPKGDRRAIWRLADQLRRLLKTNPRELWYVESALGLVEPDRRGTP